MPVSTQMSAVTSFADPSLSVTSAVSDPTAQTRLYGPIQPSAGDAPIAALTREYLVADFSWDSSVPSGNFLGTVNFPDALFSKSFIASKLDHYQYFRAGVKVTVRINGTPYVYGLLQAAWDPAPNIDGYADTEVQIYSGSGFPHILIDPGSPTVDVIEIPYTQPDPFVDLSSYQSGCLGSVDFGVLAPLRSTTGGGSVNVSVYAQFTDPVVSGATNSITLNTPAPRARNYVTY